MFHNNRYYCVYLITVHVSRDCFDRRNYTYTSSKSSPSETFWRVFQKQQTPKAKARAKPPFRVQLAYYGKVLTSDEDENRLIRAQQLGHSRCRNQKTKQRKPRKKSLTARRKRVAWTDENDKATCQGCHRKYQEDNMERQENWVEWELR